MILQSRATLDKELVELNTLISRLASMVDLAIEQAMDAVYERNAALAILVDNFNKVFT